MAIIHIQGIPFFKKGKPPICPWCGKQIKFRSPNGRKYEYFCNSWFHGPCAKLFIDKFKLIRSKALSVFEDDKSISLFITVFCYFFERSLFEYSHNDSDFILNVKEKIQNSESINNYLKENKITIDLLKIKFITELLKTEM